LANLQFFQALSEALVAAAPIATDPRWQQELLEQTAAFVDGQLDALPLLLRTGVWMSLGAFRVHSILRFRSGFRELPLGARMAAVETWANGRLAPGRQVIRALRNLALLAYHEGRARRSAARAIEDGVAVRTVANGHTTTAPRRLNNLSSRPGSQRHDDAVEVLVVGSGAGGAVTAVELASHGHNVLVVEEGNPPGDDQPDAGSTETVTRLYRHRGMTPILGHVPIAYVEGQCVGGSTEINSGFWHRPPPEALLRWKAQFDLSCASPGELRPHWEWAEQLLGVGVAQGTWPPSSEAFARGARAMDWEVHEVPRTAARARGAAANGTPDKSASAPGMSRTLIPQAVAAGARLMPGCRVEKLETNGRWVVGASLVRRREDGSEEHLRFAAEHVIVCAGPTETPSLLRRSGVVHNVGDSLRIHPMLKVAARFKENMGSGPNTLPLLQVHEFWPDIVLGGSFFTPGHVAMILADNWPVTHDRMQDVGHMASYYVGVRGTGHGTVRPSHLERGRTVIRYELSDKDIWNLSRGLARLAALLLEGGAIEVLPAVRGLAAIRDEVAAVRWLDDPLNGSACSLTTVHAFSACPIGERRDRCAADSFGKIHGFENLYINDASMVPDSPGVNPQGTIMTFARRNALQFCDEH
jgi:choline dehydrogenase-like flavoprotein